MSFLSLSYILERFFLIWCEKEEEQDPVHWQECCLALFAKSQDYYIHRVPDPHLFEWEYRFGLRKAKMLPKKDKIFWVFN